MAGTAAAKNWGGEEKKGVPWAREQALRLCQAPSELFVYIITFIWHVSVPRFGRRLFYLKWSPKILGHACHFQQWLLTWLSPQSVWNGLPVTWCLTQPLWEVAEINTDLSADVLPSPLRPATHSLGDGFPLGSEKILGGHKRTARQPVCGAPRLFSVVPGLVVEGA